MTESSGNRVQIDQSEGPYPNDGTSGNQSTIAVEGRCYHYQAGENHVREIQDKNVYAGIQDSHQTSSEHQPSATLTSEAKQRIKIVACTVIAASLLVLFGLALGGIILVSQEKLRLDKLQEKYDKIVEELHEQNKNLNASLMDKLDVKAFQSYQNKTIVNTTPLLTKADETAEVITTLLTTTPLPTTTPTPLPTTTPTPLPTTTPTPLPTTVTTTVSTTADEWTVFQRRQDGSVDFYRNWTEYVNGFGNESGEFWLGLEKLHRLTSSENYELRIDLEDWEGNSVYAQYSKFSVGSASTDYRLTVSGYSGTAGDSLVKPTYSNEWRSYSNGMAFTTKDSDNDFFSYGNCAEYYKGAWWYSDCTDANLNGVYHRGGKYSSIYASGIVWLEWKMDWEYSLKFVEMKLRPVQ